MLDDLLAEIERAPWWAIPVGIVALIGLISAAVHAVRASLPPQKDPQRMFTAVQRSEAFARAGNRCEYWKFGVFRCHGRAAHADHIYPHSRGGATVLANCAAACASCNLRKSNHVPSRWLIWRLERRRRRYFPPGEPTKVQWRLGRS